MALQSSFLPSIIYTQHHMHACSVSPCLNFQSKIPSIVRTMRVSVNELAASTSAPPKPDQSPTVPQQPSTSKNSVENSVTDLDPFPHILRAPPPSDLDLFQLISSNSASSLQATACNVVDSLISSFLSPTQLKPSVDPKLQLAGNSAPVSETPPTLCTQIKGVIPADLNGIYIRNGPNAARINEQEGYHIFDGDGMLHGVKLKDGTATFCSRYVRTSRFVQEEAAGRPLFPKFFGGFAGVSGVARIALVTVRAALGLVNVTEGWGLSNTSVGYFNGKVLSLSEDDMPYIVKVTEQGDMLTVGQLRFPQALKMNICAHPKFDPVTGEMFAFSFNPFVPPFSFFRVSADGTKSPDVPIPLLDIPLIHDFAITKKYVVFPDNQFVIRPLEFLNGEMPLVADDNKVPRFCVIPRYALPDEADQARWFEVPGCNCLHYINAWDEGDEVVLITSILTPPDRILEMPTVNLTCTLTEVRLNTRTGGSTQRKICSGNYEFGTLNQSYRGQKTRYAYVASGFYPQLTGVVKVDLEGRDSTSDACIVGRREFGDKCYGNEPFFVPRSSGMKGGEEDDGYVLCFVHDEGSGVSELLVMDAQSPSLEVNASIQLPSRVPYGFHGWFVTAEQLANQK